MISNWNDAEKLFHHSFYNELRVTPEEHPVLIIEPMSDNPSSIQAQRRKMTSIFFETFNVAALFFMNRSSASCYASGRTTGLVLNIGDNSHSAASIYEGELIQHSVICKDLGGLDVTQNFIKNLCERGYEMTTSAEMEIVKDIKEKYGYVSLDYEEELKKYEKTSHCDKEYELPDGSKMTIGNERFRSPEVLFNPTLCDSTLTGIQQSVHDCIQKNDSDLRKDLYPNIILSGGSSMFEGMMERLTKEMADLSPKNAIIKVCEPAERKFSSWIGGSILSSLSTFQNQWMTKDEYDDIGPHLSDWKHM